MTGNLPTRLTLAALAVLSAWLMVAPPAGASAPAPVRLAIGLACAAPLLILLATGVRNVPQWGIWVAIVMIPYFALGVGAFLVAPTREPGGALFATLIAAVFLGGVLAARRR